MTSGANRHREPPFCKKGVPGPSPKNSYDLRLLLSCLWSFLESLPNDNRRSQRRTQQMSLLEGAAAKYARRARSAGLSNRETIISNLDGQPRSRRLALRLMDAKCPAKGRCWHDKNKVLLVGSRNLSVGPRIAAGPVRRRIG
jgi:hypothetical protein